MSQSPGRQADLAAARLLLERMGISLEELTSGPAADRALPTFAEYVPVVAAAVSPGTNKAYGSYWNSAAALDGHADRGSDRAERLWTARWKRPW